MSSTPVPPFSTDVEPESTPVRKYCRQLLSHRLVGLRQEPEHDEERHHGRHEVGVRDLPGAAVMAAVATLHLLDDDDRFVALHADFLSSAKAFSSSSMEGRSSEKIARRPNSIESAGGRAARGGEHGFLDAAEEAPLGRVLRFDVVRERAHDAVAEQNAEEGADERRGDVVPDLFGAAVEMRHRDHDAEHGRNDAEAGQRVTGATQQRDRRVLLLMVCFELGVEELGQPSTSCFKPSTKKSIAWWRLTTLGYFLKSALLSRSFT